MSTWQLVTFPEDVPDDGPVVHEISDAVLSPYEHGEFRVAWRSPKVWTRGAVYADALLQPDSQRLGGLNGDFALAADPARWDKEPRRRLAGRWLYGGNLMGQFGHFVSETLTNLWPEPADVDGVVFHSFLWGPEVKDWMRQLIALAGYSVPIHVVTARAIGVEELVLPGRPLVINGWAHPQASQVWQRVASAVRPSPARRVYLSRNSFHQENGKSRTSASFDVAMDELFCGLGFEVVAPEALPVREQVSLAAGAQILAGPAGSALHLAAFGPQGARVLELADPRAPGRTLPQQRVVNCATGKLSAVVRHSEDPRVTAEAVRSLLAAVG